MPSCRSARPRGGGPGRRGGRKAVPRPPFPGEEARLGGGEEGLLGGEEAGARLPVGLEEVVDEEGEEGAVLDGHERRKVEATLGGVEEPHPSFPLGQGPPGAFGGRGRGEPLPKEGHPLQEGVGGGEEDGKGGSPRGGEVEGGAFGGALGDGEAHPDLASREGVQEAEKPLQGGKPRVVHPEAP